MKTVLAADLGGTKLAMAVVSAGGKIVAEQAEPVDLSLPRAPLNQLVRMAAMLTGGSLGAPDAVFRSKGELGWAPGARCQALGVAVPGLVRRSGTVWAPNLPGWRTMPLARELQRKLKLPVVVESDRNAAILGEAWQGAAKGRSDAIALIVGTGIGAGILSGGRLLRGAHELSGCAGWLVLGEQTTGRSFRCGWLERRAAGPAIAGEAARLYRARYPSKSARPRHRGLTALEVAEAARSGDRAARQVFARVGGLLGLAVANLISLFDPEVVVVGGGLAGARDLFFPALERTARGHCQPLAERRVKICTSRLGARANLLGAARLALKEL